MIEDWVVWVFLVGCAVGGLVTALLALRLPRGEADVGDAERPAEAAWISEVIVRNGGIAPRDLVEEVLDLHHAYLGGSSPVGGVLDETSDPRLPAGYEPVRAPRPVPPAAAPSMAPPAMPRPGMPPPVFPAPVPRTPTPGPPVPAPGPPRPPLPGARGPR